MEHLDPPADALWDERRLWFEAEEQRRAGAGGPVFSEQASALLIDLQAVFCAGAWAAAVILAGAIVESQTEASKVFTGAPSRDLRWLRALRNRLLHEDRGAPALTIEDQWTRREQWERSARRAVSILFQVMYPGVPGRPAAGSESGGEERL